MSKICQGVLEIWSITFWHFQKDFGGHIGSRDHEVDQRSSILPVQFNSPDCLPGLCKV